jgi:integrase
MVTVRLKGVFKVSAKGKTYFYAWRGGPRLRGEPGSAEFAQSFHEAKGSFANSDRKRLASWVANYRASDHFKKLAPSTQRLWLRWLDEISDHFGNLDIRLFDKAEIRLDISAWRNRWRHQPRNADYAKQVLSALLTFVAENGALMNNPCIGMKNFYHNDRSDIIWSDQDIDDFCKVASIELAWAVRFAALTGFRLGDLLRVSWSHVQSNSIEIKTGKSRERRTATVVIGSSLRALLAEIPKRATTILTNSDGKPWRGFSSSFKKAMLLSGLKERGLHFHDLRGTAATRFYLAGFKEREIAVMMGWSEDKVERILDRYVRRDELIQEKVRRLNEHDARTKTAKPIAKL